MPKIANVKRNLAAVMAVSTAAMLFAGCGGSGDTEAKTRILNGTFTLSGSSNSTHPQGDGGFCYGDDGYDDIEAGLRVVVADGNGKTLATGSLGNSRYNAAERDCVFPVIVTTPLPKADFYSVEVGRRGDLTYSYDEMVQRNWAVAFTLG